MTSPRANAPPKRRPAVERPRRSGWPWLLPAVAAVLAAVVYVNALDNPFVYDDHETVVANPSLVDLSNLRFIAVYSPFRPVVNASYALDRLIWGYRPLGFHLTNIALHALSVVLLYVFLCRALADAGLTHRPEAAAFAAAALFAVHPLQSEAVAYVSGRSELLCAVWFLAATILARDAMAGRGKARAVAAACCGVLAIASKEVAIVLPLVLVGYDWLLGPGTPGGSRRRLLRVFLPIFGLLLAAGAYRALALRATPLGLHVESPLLNLLTQAIVVWRYIGLLVWPAGQSIMHSVHRVTALTDPLGWTAAAGLAVLAAVAFRVRRSAPLVTFGVLWFFAVLAPSSSIVALREGMAEHRVYLASAGVFMVIAAVAERILERVRTANRQVPVAYGVGLMVILAILSGLTFMRNRVWSSPLSLWAEAAHRAPGMWEPHYALADSLREAGDCGAAVPEYQAVVDRYPSHRDAQTNLGICLAQTGRLEEAEQAFRRVLAIDPAFARGYTNLGALALLAGDMERARDYYREAIAQEPRNVLARMQLASLYERTFHDYHAAARMCGEARLIAPSTPGVVECVERNQRLAAARDSGR